MNKTLFLHSEVTDPYVIYRERLAEGGIHWDQDAGVWAIYSYDACRQVLTHPSALIPFSAGEGLSAYAQMIKDGLVRLQNPPLHAHTRGFTGRLFENSRRPDWSALMGSLITTDDIDWVARVAGRLPAMGILAGYGFDSRQQELIVEHLPQLVKIMQPPTLPEGAALINDAAATIGQCLEQRLPEAAIGAVTGLLIQSYDAGKGILCNGLLHACAKGRQTDWNAFVTEVLHYDPPVHHTRRIAGECLHIGGYRIEKGDKMVLFLAAANRDKMHEEDLSLGAGPHACMAREFVTGMTAECLEYLFRRWEVRQGEDTLVYEPLFNVRVPLRMPVQLTERALP